MNVRTVSETMRRPAGMPREIATDSKNAQRWRHENQTHALSMTPVGAYVSFFTGVVSSIAAFFAKRSDNVLVNAVSPILYAVGVFGTGAGAGMSIFSASNSTNIRNHERSKMTMGDVIEMESSRRQTKQKTTRQRDQRTQTRQSDTTPYAFQAIIDRSGGPLKHKAN